MLEIQIVDLTGEPMSHSSSFSPDGKLQTLTSLSWPPVTSRPVRLPLATTRSALRTIWPCLTEMIGWPLLTFHTLAVKSAEPVTARSPNSEIREHQIAPLWPRNVPIQSPVTPFRSIGFPSIRNRKLIFAQKMQKGGMIERKIGKKPVFSKLYLWQDILRC